MKVLVTAASKHGSTEAIARTIGEILAGHGLETELLPPDDVDGIERYDAVVLGSAVYAGRWLQPAKDLVERAGAALASRPVWLFSSGPIGDPPKPEGEPEEAAQFRKATNAREHRVFAGKLDKTSLGFRERAMVMAVRAADGDFRQWSEIEEWASRIADTLQGSPNDEVVASSPADSVPKPIEAGAEMEALARFHSDVTWTGTIEEGGMGPGTPAMTAVGSGKHQRIQGGRWIVGDYQQDQFLADGTFLLKWELHWVAGWDPLAREYRATVADNYGHADVMRGWIDGDRLTFETIGEPPVRIRLVWDVSDPERLTWRNEASVGGGPWSLVEEYRCTAR